MNRARPLLFVLLVVSCGSPDDRASSPDPSGSEAPPDGGERSSTQAPEDKAPAPGDCADQPCVTAPADDAASYGYELVERGSELYWTSWGPPTLPPDGRVFAVRKDGSSPPRVLARGLNFPAGLASDATHVYVAVANANEVLRCSDAACEEQPFLSRAGRPYAVAVDATDVYVAYIGEGGSSEGAIVRCAKSGCAEGGTVIAATRAKPDSIAVTGTTVFWTEQQDYSLASGGTNAVHACPTSGCGASGPTVVASGLDGAGRVRVGPNGVYWMIRGSLAPAQPRSNAPTGAGIMIADADGKNAQLAHAWSGFMDDVAASLRGFFVADPAQVAFVKSPEGSSTKLPFNEPPRALTVDSTFLYVLGSAGSIHRRRLPE